MNQKTSQKRFQDMKQEFIDNGWVIVEDAEKQTIVKDEDDSFYTLSLLEDETNHFLQLEPSMAMSSIQRVYCEEDAEDDVTLVFELENYRFSITAVMYDLVENGVYCYLSKAECFDEENEKYQRILHIGFPVSINQQVKWIYQNFKKVLTESPLYRLHFVTHTIEFDSDPFLKDE